MWLISHSAVCLALYTLICKREIGNKLQQLDMIFNQKLVHGILLKRYKRFLADVKIDDGSIITAHCPNTGSMRGCSSPDSPVALSISDNPKRKYSHTLEMVQSSGTWIGVNTSLTNKLVAEAITNGLIAEFKEVDSIQREVKVSAKSRLDLLVSHDNTSTFIEIKNCSLAENNRAMFPDAVTQRGSKHLLELIQLSRQGQRACIFFLIQRMDADRFAPAAHIDLTYAKLLRQAHDEGVKVLAYQAEVSPKEIRVIRSLPSTL